MTKVVEQIAETVVYDDEYDVEEGNGKTSTNNNNNNASEEEEEGNASEEREEEQQQQQQLIIEIETKYERYRDDQMNTGIIAALVGGFALTNSWEMNIYENNENENENKLVSNIELSSYTLAILAVHGCTCSALVSAFLYRSITRVKSPQAGVQWVERHPILVQLPWYKFLFGTASYIISVILVAWTTLQFNTVSRIITLVGGICGCSIVVYTCYIIYTDAACLIECEDEDDHHHEGNNKGNDRKQQRRHAGGSSGSASLKKIPSSMKNKNKKKKNGFSSNIQLGVGVRF